jgi:hypothetical protein
MFATATARVPLVSDRGVIDWMGSEALLDVVEANAESTPISTKGSLTLATGTYPSGGAEDNDDGRWR